MGFREEWIGAAGVFRTGLGSRLPEMPLCVEVCYGELVFINITSSELQPRIIDRYIYT